MKILSSAAFTRALSAPHRLLAAALVPALAAVLGFTGVTVSQAATPHSPAARPAPVLGRVSGSFFRARGLGQVKPHRVDLGGDPTSVVSGITWTSWGRARARGTGKSTWVPPGQPVAHGRLQRATIVGFHRGMCHGKFMYKAVEWYFPQHHGHFKPHSYANICAGKFVRG